jgi:hypothetical protein
LNLRVRGNSVAEKKFGIWILRGWRGIIDCNIEQGLDSFANHSEPAQGKRKTLTGTTE